MSGICGIIQFHKTYSKGELSALYSNMNCTESYSDEQCVIGCSSYAWNEEKEVILFINGGFFNQSEIKEKLLSLGHTFATTSDAEIALHIFEEQGIDGINELDGMFTILIYEVKEKNWIIVRDRTGGKPLFYYHDNNLLLVASELKTILKTGLVPKNIDKAAFERYCRLTYIPSPFCIIENVKKCMPATYMKVDSEGIIESKKYWSLKNTINDADVKEYEKSKEILREEVFLSVERRMIDEEPVGAFLSGGIDSSIIVGVMSQIATKPVETFTVGFEDAQYDERDLAAIVAKKNGAKNSTLLLNWEDAFSDVDYILENLDEPYADSSLIATYEVSKMASQYMRVALTGDAGDELFAGYDKYLIGYYSNVYNKIPRFLRKGLIEPFINKQAYDSILKRKADKVIRASSLSSPEQIKWMMSLGLKEEEAKEALKFYNEDSLSFIDGYLFDLDTDDWQLKNQYSDFHVVLEGDMLVKADKGSSLAAIETRAPFLSKKIIEIVSALPTEYKIRGKERKIILKDTFKDCLVEEIKRTPKRGFRVPMATWIEDKLQFEMFDMIKDKDFNEFFDGEYVKGLLWNHVNHKENRFSELWCIYVFYKWYKLNIG